MVISTDTTKYVDSFFKNSLSGNALKNFFAENRTGLQYVLFYKGRSATSGGGGPGIWHVGRRSNLSVQSPHFRHKGILNVTQKAHPEKISSASGE